MWIFAKHGFVSIVAHRDKPRHYLIRARVRDDLSSILSLIDGHAVMPRIIIHTPDADYPYRATIGHAGLALLMGLLAGTIDYPNFKAAVHGDADRDAAYSTVHAAMNHFGRVKEIEHGES